ncbi:MAG: hypothetical protein NUW09_06465 [Deltaproteobacteria bacterium]|nr:hypothetical protein [Deltaproteobacteria bacterium]
MAEEIREAVKVMVIFDAGIRPVKFRWRDKVYPVKDVTHSWKSKDGGVALMHFAVTDGKALYELSYNPLASIWLLEKVEP